MSEHRQLNQLDRATITVNRIGNLILTGGVAVGSIVGAVFLLLSDAMPPVWRWVLLVTLFAFNLGLLLFSIYWPAIAYRHVSWSISAVGFEIDRGVFWKHRIAIPWARMQHADLSQGPLERMFSLSSLTIHTAGTKNASVEIGGLNRATAIELIDEMIRQRKADDVV